MAILLKQSLMSYWSSLWLQQLTGLVDLINNITFINWKSAEYLHIYIYIHTHIYINIYIIHTYIYMFRYMYMYIFIYVYIHIYIYIYIYIYIIYIYIHIYVHIYTFIIFYNKDVEATSNPMTNLWTCSFIKVDNLTANLHVSSSYTLYRRIFYNSKCRKFVINEKTWLKDWWYWWDMQWCT